MRIIPKTKKEYAQVVWEGADEERISDLQKTLFFSLDMAPLKGLRIEISQCDSVQDDVRRSLDDGRFFEVK